MAHLATARVLLMGTGNYHDRSGLPGIPAVPSTLTDLHEVLTRRCQVSPHAIDILCDPTSPVEMGDAVAAAADAADDLLFVYYVGHGLVSANGCLYLATARTDRWPTHVEHTALPYDIVRRYLLDRAPRSVVVILDCCFSGRALNTLGGSEEEIVSLAAVDGAFVLTSAGRAELALAPPGHRHTAFTGELLRLLEHGDPNGPAEITVHHACRYLDRNLLAAGYPRPQYQSRGTAGNLVLALNAAHSRPANPPSPVAPTPSTTDKSEPKPRRRHRSAVIAAGVGVVLIVATVLLIQRLNTPAENDGGETPGRPCQITVTSDILNIREAPQPAAQIVGRLDRSTVVNAETTVQNGFRKLSENRWASTDFISPVPGTDCG